MEVAIQEELDAQRQYMVIGNLALPKFLVGFFFWWFLMWVGQRPRRGRCPCYLDWLLMRTGCIYLEPDLEQYFFRWSGSCPLKSGYSTLKIPIHTHEHLLEAWMEATNDWLDTPEAWLETDIGWIWDPCHPGLRIRERTDGRTNGRTRVVASRF